MPVRVPVRALIVLLACVLSSCALPADPGTNSVTPSAPFSSPGSATTDAMIFAGNGTWGTEVDSIRDVLYAHSASYQSASSEQLESMSLEEIARYKVLIFPGGDAATMTGSLSDASRARLRAAVQERGVGYLGFCAGAWLAVAPAPRPGEDVIYGFGVVEGPVLVQNYLSEQGKHFALSKASFVDGSQRNLLWYGGPITPTLPGGVIAKYPDGTPAITQMRSGRGWVIVSGLHPATNLALLSALGLADREAIAPDFAWKLLDGVIRQTALPAFP